METFIAHLTSNNAQIRNIDDIFDNVQGLCNENNEWFFFIVSNDNEMFSNNTFVKLCKIQLQNCRSTGNLGWRTVELQLRPCNKCVFIAHGLRLIKLI